MAKREKTTRFSIQGFDLKHYRTTEQYAAAVQALFDRATLAIAQSASGSKIDPDKPFSFDDYPQVKAELQKVVGQLASQLKTTIESGSKKQWLFACAKNDGFLASIMDTSKLSKARLKKMQDRNLDALSAFQTRKVDGMNLSQRVWRYVGQYRDQIETALDVGLGDGRSAQQLARDVKMNLQEPNRLFRRVRDKRGNLVLSKAARAFHPGQGVYRSSVKNAQRLTRSEINMAYRESDFLRWQQLDFVVGFEIHRSNHRPLCKCKMCDRLQGRYPKTFKFKGWHPQCMCFATPILMDEETFDENELGDLKAALNGTEYKQKQAKNVVLDVPDGFKEWVAENMEASANWSSTPYFIKDNFVDGDLAKGLKIALPTVAPDVPGVSYVPIKTVEEAKALATTLGIKKVDFGDATIDEINIALEVLHEASNQMDFELDYFFLAQDIHKQSKSFTKPVGGYYSADRKEMAIDLTTFRKSQFQPVVSYKDKIVSLRNNIASLERQIEQSETRLGRSKSMDKMLKADIKMLRSRIADIEIKINQFEKLIARGNDALPFTVAASFEDVKKQVQAEIWHEIGHYIDHKTGQQRFKEGNFISEYCKDTRDEEFAEWFSYYKMNGEKGVPDDLLKIFKSVERNHPEKQTPKPDPVQAQLDALMPQIEAARKIAEEWGLDYRLKGLNVAVDTKDVKEATKFVSLITTEGSKYTTELSAFLKDATQLIKDINAAGVGVLPDVVAELAQYITNLSARKKDWVDGASFYKSELERAKDKLREYKASPESRLTDVQKQYIATIRKDIKEAEEWGIPTASIKSALSQFLNDPTDDNYWAMFDVETELSGKIRKKIKQLEKFIADANALMKEATNLGVDSSEVSKHVFYLSGRDRAYSWENLKRERNAAFNDLQARVNEAKKHQAEEAAKAQQSSLNPTFTGKPHPAMKTSYLTDAEVDATFTEINKDFTTEKWFEHGDLRLTPTRKSGVNGFTYMDGRISLTPDRLKRVKSALGKIGQGKSSEITFEEADAMATLWHEICHNRNIPSYKQGDKTKMQTRFMELANEFVARHTLPEFYAKLGASEVPHPEFQTNRDSTGYNKMVTNYDFVIKEMRLDHSKVLASVRKHLFTGGYNDQQTGLAQALLDGGLKYADGKAVKKSDLNALLKLIRTLESGRREYDSTTRSFVTTMSREGIILEWLKEHKFIK